MKSTYEKFKFLVNQGLYFEETFLIESNIQVVQKKFSFGEKNEKITEYLVRALAVDGKLLNEIWLKDLKRIDLWLLGINDALLEPEQYKLLVFKLLHEAQELTAQIYLVDQLGIRQINEHTVFFLGEHMLLPQNERLENAVFKSKFRMSISGKHESGTVSACLNMLPGVTELLFYSSLYSLVKPILKECEIDGGFINALVGPPGHLKTSLIRKYALWLDDISQQEIGFYVSKRNSILLDLIESMSGQNFLLDDLHRVENRSENLRQQQRLEAVARHVSSVRECANVFITGESLADMGIFSCIDRTLQISIDHMNVEEITNFKKRMSLMPNDFMRNVAFIFAKRLMNNYHEVLQEVKNYYKANVNVVGQSDGHITRIQRYAMFLRMTRYLFCKYCEEFDRGADDEEAFEKALEKQLNIQNRELQSLGKNIEKSDYVIELFKILEEEKVIKIVHNPKNYFCDESSCCVKRDKVYFTTRALEKAFLTYHGHYIKVKEVVRQLYSKGVLETESASNGFQKNFKDRKHYVINMPMMLYYLVEQGYPITKDLLDMFGVTLKQ